MLNLRKNVLTALVIAYGIFLFSGQAFAGSLNCGSANGAPFEFAPTENLCSVGTASAVSGSTPWTWTCTDDLCTNECVSDCVAYVMTKTETPHADPAGGTYSGPVSVSVSTGTWFDTIYYTTDGSTPTRSSTMDTLGNIIEISSNTTLKAFATMAGSLDSDIMTEVYTFSAGEIVPAAPTNVIATPGNAQISVAFTPGVGGGAATSYYVHCNAGGYAYDRTVTASPTIVHVDYGRNGYDSVCTVSAINSAGESPTSEDSNVVVTSYFGAFLAGAPTIVQPLVCTNSTEDLFFESVSGNGGLGDMFFKKFAPSATTSNIQFNTNVASSCFIDDDINFTSSIATINTTTHNFGSFDLKPPGEFLDLYLVCKESVTSKNSPVNNIKLFVQSEIVEGGVNGVCGAANGVPVSTAPTGFDRCSAGNETTATGTGPWYWTCVGISGGTTANCSAPLLSAEPTQVVAPTASPNGGTYSSTQSVTLSSTTSGATIYYTTNGSTPTTSSNQYSGAISISSTTTLKAIAVKSGMTNSTVMSQAYTISTAAGTVGNVNAGTDKTVNSQTTLTGSATGTGLSYAWAKQSGFGTITFGSADSQSTMVSADTDGVYVIRLTVTDSTGVSAYDDMILTWDTSFPYATFNSFETKDTTPGISGTYSGSLVGIIVYIGSNSYPAVINASRTWTIADNTISPELSKNTYSIRVRAFDLAGNTSDTYVNLKITDGSSNDNNSNDSNNSSSSSKDDHPKTIKDSKKVVRNGDVIVQSGKNFAKNRKLLLYFQRSNGSYYAPQAITTDSSGKFSIRYKVNKPFGVYNWFAQDYMSGKKVWAKYRIE